MRARRIGAFALDVLIVGAPWLALVGPQVITPPWIGMGGLGAFVVLLGACALGSAVLMLMQIALLVGARRTVGMGSVTVTPGRHRWRGLWIDVVLLMGVGAPLAVALADVKEYAGAACLGAVPVVLLLGAEFALFASTRTTLGTRALDGQVRASQR